VIKEAIKLMELEEFRTGETIANDGLLFLLKGTVGEFQKQKNP
jgi:hypothetical protein